MSKSKNFDGFRWFSIELLGPDRKPHRFRYRGVTRFEERAAGSRPDQYSADGYILSRCVEGDYDWETMPYGTAQRLLAEIYELSGHTEAELPWHDAISWIRSTEGQIEALSLTMVPGLTLEHLDTCDPQNRCRYLIAARWLFERLYGMPIQQIVGSDDEEPQAAPQRQHVPDAAQTLGPHFQQVETVEFRSR